MKKKKVIFDMDGVIARTHYCLEKKLKERYPGFELNNVYTYYFNKELGQEKMDLLQCPHDEIFKEFCNPDVFEQAELEPGVIELMEQYMDEYEFEIHSLAYTEEVKEAKLRWLQDKFGDKLKYFSKIEIVVGKTKPALEDVAYVFEDTLKQIRKYNELNPNTKAILFDMPYNQEFYNQEYNDVFQHLHQRITCFSEAKL